MLINIVVLHFRMFQKIKKTYIINFNVRKGNNRNWPFILKSDFNEFTFPDHTVEN